MTVIEDREFCDFRDISLFPWQRAQVYGDLRFVRCRFESFRVSATLDLKRRSVAKRLQFLDCETGSGFIGPAVVDEVEFVNLKTRTLLQVWGAAFRHVTLRGRLGRLMISDMISMLPTPQAKQDAFDDANRSFYQEVDWALDISDAEFIDADLRGVPGHLIRIDPATQLLVTREQAIAGTWRQVDLTDTHWDHSLTMLAAHPWMPSKVLVAPKRSPAFKKLLAGLQRLREAGIGQSNSAQS